MFSVEKEIAKYFPFEDNLSYGVEGLAQQVASENHFPVPKIVFFKDPVPNAVVARGIFGQGMLLLSRGLVESYSESEFCQILERLMTRLYGRGTRTRTFFSLLAAKWVSFMPQKWVAFFWEIPNKDSQRLDFFSGIVSVMLLSLSKLTLYLGRIFAGILNIGARKTRGVEEPKLNATEFPILTGNPGIGPLYMVDPWAGRFFWS